jgi:hypothetical protein
MRLLSKHSADSVVLGTLLAALWSFHAAAFGLPGRAYFHVARLNDSSQMVGVNVLLHPAFVLSMLLLAAAVKGKRPARQGSHRAIALGLACWLTAATVSTLLHVTVPQVSVTYAAGFLAGLAIYVALARTTLTPRALEMGIAGLVAGALVPLVGGVQAYWREWGASDPDTVISAYQSLARMAQYETATFGSRSNTAAFVVIVFPLLAWVALDRTRSRWLRLLCAAALVPVVMNLLILQVRAALVVAVLSVAVVWGFKLGVRRYPLFLASAACGVLLLVSWLPDASYTMVERMRPVVTLEASDDRSASERLDSVREGLETAERHWQFGIGPGASLTQHSYTAAHQFHVQQFMETGVLGLAGSTLLSIAVLFLLMQTMARGQDGGLNNVRFAMIVGPAAFVVYATLANATLTIGYINTWTVLLVSMLALTPPMEPRRAARRAARAVVNAA